MKSYPNISQTCTAPAFHRAPAPRPPVLPGVRPSPRTGRPLVSCSAPHLDSLLGGGLPLGTLLPIREDRQGSYARLLTSLPALDTPGGEEQAVAGLEERMRIAWWYQGQASTKGEPPRAAKVHSFNLTRCTGPSGPLHLAAWFFWPKASMWFTIKGTLERGRRCDFHRRRSSTKHGAQLVF
jgi:hypothetical protein